MVGQLVTSVGFDGGTQSVEYDSLGRVVSETAADGSQTSYTYNSAGQVLTVTAADPDGAGPTVAPVVSMTYDALGRITQQTAPDGSSTSTSFNDAGQVISVSDGEGRLTSFGYDAFGRQNQVSDSLGNSSTLVFDDLHRVTSTTDGLGKTSTFQYDNLSRLISQTDSLVGTTGTEYDALGRVVSLTDPVGNQTTWTYDDAGRLSSDTNDLGGTRSYAYDDAGRLSSRTDRNGRVIDFGYDNLGRQTSQQWMNAGIAVNTIATTYNDDLRVSAISDDDSAYAFTWDSVGRLLTVDNTGTAGSPDVVLTNTYDELGRQTGLSAAIDGIADFTNSYAFDANSRIASITQTDGSPTAGSTVSDKRVDLTYDDSGRFETITRYEDLTATDEIATTSYAYDTTGRLTSLDHAFGTISLAGYTWAWDAADRITNYTSVLDGSVAYGYDNTGQLTSEARTNLAGTTQTTVYNYDANGNRLTAGDAAAPATYTTGANNRTLSDGTYNYEYDAEGNRTKKTEIASGDEVEYTWNHANLLTEVVYRDSLGVTTKSVSYQYDALGRRIGKSVDDTGNGTIDRSQTFIYDGAGLLAASGGSIQISGPNGQLNQHGWVDDLVLVFEDTDGAGPQSSSLSSRFLHGPAIDQIFAQESATGEVLWALADHQGTVKDWAKSADFDNNGTTETEVVKHITFDTFGNILSVADGSGSEISNAESDILHAYTGQLYDADAGLHYYRARWYDSVSGRFVSEDPMGFVAGDTNTSRYVGNRVANGVDPTGLVDPNSKLRKIKMKSCLSHLDGCAGVYEFPDLQYPGNPPYTGESHDIYDRLLKHVEDGRFDPDGDLQTWPVPGGKDARERFEHERVQENTGGVHPRHSDDSANKKNPYGRARRDREGMPHPEIPKKGPGEIIRTLGILGTIGDVIEISILPIRSISSGRPPWEIWEEDARQEAEELKEKGPWLVTPGYIGPNPVWEGGGGGMTSGGPMA